MNSTTKIAAALPATPPLPACPPARLTPTALAVQASTAFQDTATGSAAALRHRSATGVALAAAAVWMPSSSATAAVISPKFHNSKDAEGSHPRGAPV